MARVALCLQRFASLTEWIGLMIVLEVGLTTSTWLSSLLLPNHTLPSVRMLGSQPSWAQPSNADSPSPPGRSPANSGVSPAAPPEASKPSDATLPSSTTDLLHSPDPDFPLSSLELEQLFQGSDPPQHLSIDLALLPLLPHAQTALWLTKEFDLQVSQLNERIAQRQSALANLLRNPRISDDRIRQAQSILSQLRSERDRLAIEHLLLLRKVQDNGLRPPSPTQPTTTQVAPE